VIFRGWQSAVDFVVLSAALYALLVWARQIRALRVALVAAGLHAAALTARQFDLIITGWVLDAAAVIAIVLLVLLFQGELRHALIRLDSVTSLWTHPATAMSPRFQPLAEAAFALGRAGLGALIVLVRNESVSELIRGGASLNAEVSPELLIALFQKSSPLHDGAVLIEKGRLARAGIILPLTERVEVPKHFGTRHRAAMGLAERSDALVIAVSEERGAVTLFQDREWNIFPSPVELTAALKKLHARPPVNLGVRLRRSVTANLGFKFAALALAALFWGISFLPTGATVRTLSVPVEFRNVPAGMQITRQSVDRFEVQLRGSNWIMEGVSLGRLVARFNLAGAKEGLLTVPLERGNLDLPPGVRLDRASPPEVSVRLAPQKK
jgi:diadenylate cyclase